MDPPSSGRRSTPTPTAAGGKPSHARRAETINPSLPASPEAALPFRAPDAAGSQPDAARRASEPDLTALPFSPPSSQPPQRIATPVQGITAPPVRSPTPVQGITAAPARSPTPVQGITAAPARSPTPVQGITAAPARSPTPVAGVGSPAGPATAPAGGEAPRKRERTTMKMPIPAGLPGAALPAEAPAPRRAPTPVTGVDHSASERTTIPMAPPTPVQAPNRAPLDAGPHVPMHGPMSAAPVSPPHGFPVAVAPPVEPARESYPPPPPPLGAMPHPGSYPPPSPLGAMPHAGSYPPPPPLSPFASDSYPPPPPVGPVLDLAQLAALAAEIAAWPASIAEIRARYGLDEGSHRSIAAAWQHRFASDGHSYQRYIALYEFYRGLIARRR